jgi:hypothetical protein
MASIKSGHRAVLSLSSKLAARGGQAARAFGSGAKARNTGILAMEMYVPNRYVAQDALEKADGVSAGKYTIGKCLCFAVNDHFAWDPASVRYAADSRHGVTSPARAASRALSDHASRKDALWAY